MNTTQQVCKNCGSNAVARCKWVNVNHNEIYDADSGTVLEWCMACEEETSIIDSDEYEPSSDKVEDFADRKELNIDTPENYKEAKQEYLKLFRQINWLHGFIFQWEQYEQEGNRATTLANMAQTFCQWASQNNNPTATPYDLLESLQLELYKTAE